ncbi:MAG: phosphotransferase family protein [Thermaerobacter sp.]|nr:phosphotransferase family protein [Thermaerobacter sp.]
MNGVFSRRLAEYLLTRCPGLATIRLSEMRLASGGWSDETYLFRMDGTDHHGQPHTRELALRKRLPGGLLAGASDFRRHYDLLALVGRHTSLPVPRAYLYEGDASILGAPFFIMSKLEGNPVVPWSKPGREFLQRAHDQGVVPEQFVQYLAALHGLDLDAVEAGRAAPVPAAGYGYIDRKLGELEQQFAEYRTGPDPLWVDAFSWLVSNRPRRDRYVLLHGDYRTGNMLYGESGITAILDWQAAEIGDPMSDLGYVAARLNRMDSPLLCYLLDRDRFFRRYQELSGIPVESDAVHYYQVLHQVRFVLLALSAGQTFAASARPDLRLARQGLRWPLMRLLLAEEMGYKPIQGVNGCDSAAQNI